MSGPWVGDGQEGQESLRVAEAAERRRMAIALHDDVLPAVSASALRLELIRRRLDADDVARTDIAEVEAWLREAATAMRALVAGLSVTDAVPAVRLKGGAQRTAGRPRPTPGRSRDGRG